MNQHQDASRIFQYAPFERNSILHLVLFVASTYILLHMVIILFIILSDAEKNAYQAYILPYAGIRDWDTWLRKPWTLFTYTLGQKSFFTLLTNMVWLYIFGTVIQQYISAKEVFPMFFLTYIISGLLYLVLTMAAGISNAHYILNSMPAVTSFAFGSWAIQPDRKMEVGIPWKIPLWLFVLVFSALVLLTSGSLSSSSWILYLISAVTGLVYGTLLRMGRRPGSVVQDSIDKLRIAVSGNDEKIDGWRVDKFEEALRANNTDLGEQEIREILIKLKKGGMGALNIRERSYLFKSK